jgi:hypothetical protein
MKNGICVLALFLLALPVFSDGPDFSGWELFLFYGLDLSGKTYAYPNSYDPHPGYHISGSYARQTLNLDPGIGQGITLGIGRFFPGGFGVRLTARRRTMSLGGENTPYEYSYLYTLITPPNYEPIETSTYREVDWVPTDGSIGLTSLSLEAAFRLPVATGVAIVFSAGPSLHFAGGRFAPLAFTEQWLGGHGTPNLQDYLVYLKLSGESRLGLQAGIEASVRLSGAVSLAVRAAYALTGSFALQPEVDEVYYYSYLDPTPQEKVNLVLSRFKLEPLTMSLSAAALGAGLNFNF